MDRQRSSCAANAVPGYRTELTPFGGIGDSGLGVKEGMRETRAMSFTSTELDVVVAAAAAAAAASFRLRAPHRARDAP